MGAFGIFAAVLTFIYVIYYSVMIGMDLFGSKAQKKESVEIISPTVGAGHSSEELDEQPTVIAEDGMPWIEPEAESTNGHEVSQGPERSVSREDIESADDNELYQKAMTVKMQEMEEVEIHSAIEYTTDEYEANLAQLMKEQEVYAEGLS